MSDNTDGPVDLSQPLPTLPDDTAATTTTTDDRSVSRTIATPPVPTAEEVDRAQRDLPLAQEALNLDKTSVGNDSRLALIERIAKATDVITRAADAKRAPEPTATERMQVLGQRLTLKTAMAENTRLQNALPEGSEERALRADYGILLASQEDALANAGKPVPGSFSHRDVDGAIKDAQLDSVQGATLKLAAHRLGLAPMATTQLAWAIRDSRSEARYVTTDERETLWSSWWGEDSPTRVTNAATFARMWNDRLTAGERELLRPLLASRTFTETVINLGAQLGTRR